MSGHLKSNGFKQTRNANKNAYYAVAKGKQIGIYMNWNDCKSQVDGYQGAKFKKFGSASEADAFIKSGGVYNSIPVAEPSSYSNFNATACTKRKDLEESCDNDNASKRLAMWKEKNQGPNGLKKNHLILAEDSILPSYNLLTKDKVLTEPTATVWTDGACTGNGKSRAKGGIGVFWGVNDPRNISEPLEGRQTNNRAEILAAVKAINQAKEENLNSVVVCTDSGFLINSATNWMKKWKKNGWQLVDKKPVKNREDFLMLDKAMEGIRVFWKKVKGHAGIAGNEAADYLAVQGVGKR